MPPYVSLILGAIFALAGWQEARRFGRVYGRTPWGWDPLVWGAILGLVWPIGLLLLAISERTGRAEATKRASAPTASQASPSTEGNVLPRF